MKASWPRRRSEAERRRNLAPTFYDFRDGVPGSRLGRSGKPSSRTSSAKARAGLAREQGGCGLKRGYESVPSLKTNVRGAKGSVHQPNGTSSTRRTQKAEGLRTPARFARRACYNAVTKSSRVGSKFMSVHRKTRIGRCMPAIRFFVFAVLAVSPVRSFVGLMYFLGRRWL